MALLSLQAVAAATGGTVYSGDPRLEVDSYAIDSRAIRGGELFFALVGDRNDGHDYLADVYAAGAAATVVSRLDAAPGPAIRVTDTTSALRALARRVRRDWGGTVIGITGSCGKTTTKEMLRLVLAASRPVLATRGNLNNLYGLPLMLLELLPEHETAVLEMGISTPGEMAPLADIAGPDVAVLLNVEAVHLVHFSSLDEIATTKAAILDALRPGGTFVYNADDARVAALASRHDGATMSFGLSRDADVAASEVDEGRAEGIRARVRAGNESAGLDLPVPGRHNLMNALAALAAARVVGVPLAAGVAALTAFSPPPMRGTRTRLAHDVTIWDESYNSNPVALRAVLTTLGQAPTRGRRVLVCGDMLELGSAAEEIHLDLAPDVAAAGVDIFVAVGPLSSGLANRLAREYDMTMVTCADAGEAAERVVALVHDHDLVVIKGSRGMNTDRVATALAAARGGDKA